MLMKEIARKYAFKNALDFGGKVNANVILGLVLKENPDLKSNVPALLKEIHAVIKEVEKLDQNTIKAQLVKLAPELLVETKEEKMEGPLKPLPNAEKGKVVVRIAPSPSGPLHIGHAYGVSLNYEYAKMYGGKLILRIEDTNPENIYPPAYELIERDAQWLTNNGVAQVVIQSDRLGIYYDYAEKLVQQGNTYVCTCDGDIWRELKNKGIACPCRELSVKENQERYAKMFSSYAEGEAVVRLKTDIQHKNPAMRDFPIMRINEHVHPKKGKEQRVWPLMVYSVAIDDHELGITHVLNGKDHADNAQKEKMIMDCFGWKHPEYKHWGMINFDGFELSTSKTRLAIEQRQYTGWEDVRLPFLPALRKRGYQPGAFRRFAIEMGLSLNDKKVSMEEFWKSINAFDKEIIEPNANRYFFVDNPVNVKMEGAPAITAQVEVHPNFPQRGERTFQTKGEFYISKMDLELLEEHKIHRLMDCLNFEVKGKSFVYLAGKYEDYKNAANRGSIIHWLPVLETVAMDVKLEDGTTVTGVGEKGLSLLKEGSIVQLERYFARLELKEKNKLQFWKLHT